MLLQTDLDDLRMWKIVTTCAYRPIPTMLIVWLVNLVPEPMYICRLLILVFYCQDPLHFAIRYILYSHCWNASHTWLIPGQKPRAAVRKFLTSTNLNLIVQSFDSKQDYRGAHRLFSSWIMGDGALSNLRYLTQNKSTAFLISFILALSVATLLLLLKQANGV